MPTRRAVLSSSLGSLTGCSLPGLTAAVPGPGASLVAYASEAELRQALDRWRTRAQELQPRGRRGETAADSAGSLAMSLAPGAPAQVPAPAAARSLPTPAAESITNVQTAGVDEGGIVKRAGDYLVILRRGRLFTVRVGAGALAPVAAVDAYAPGSDPRGAWYDELLVAGSTVVVIGYSYARGGTEIGLFALKPDGALDYRATHHLRSVDYWSSRNYASRLIGDKLVFYTPTLFRPWGPAPWDMLPGLRRWQDVATPPEFERILPATRVYRTDDEFEPGEPLALHAVTACDLSAPGTRLRCESMAVLGPAGRVFYVSQGAVYVWTRSWLRQATGRGEGEPRRAASAVFRIPLDFAAPTALKTAGVPIDQLSFLEDRSHLNVLLREDGTGEGMWGAERSRGALALLRVPLSAFGDGRGAAQAEHYRRLPGSPGVAQNRYVGDWLLWGGGEARLHAVRYADAADAAVLDVGHAVERIEALGRDAVAIGNAGADLRFTGLRLDGVTPRIAATHVQPGAMQGETRTHGFFYRPTGADDGLLGLPVLGSGGPRRHGVYGDAQGAAAVLYLRQRSLAFTALGELHARPEAARRGDGCKASCVDWYGNARPIFMDGRVLALLGYELVEGEIGGEARERIEEKRRISFAPGARDGRDGRDIRHWPFG